MPCRREALRRRPEAPHRRSEAPRGGVEAFSPSAGASHGQHALRYGKTPPQQEALREQLAGSLNNTPGELWLDMGKKQMDAWQDMQKEFFETLSTTPKKSRRP